MCSEEYPAEKGGTSHPSILSLTPLLPDLNLVRRHQRCGDDGMRLRVYVLSLIDMQNTLLYKKIQNHVCSMRVFSECSTN